jgi:hypothetical protein
MTVGVLTLVGTRKGLLMPGYGQGNGQGNRPR